MSRNTVGVLLILSGAYLLYVAYKGEGFLATTRGIFDVSGQEPSGGLTPNPDNIQGGLTPRNAEDSTYTQN